MSLFNIADMFSTVIAVWTAYNLESEYKEVMTFLCVNYHALQVLMFFAMIFYVFKWRKLHERIPLNERVEDEDDWKQGYRCMVFFYSPLMANVKFMGLPTAFTVYVSNDTSYFNHFYFGMNILTEALISSGPLILVQALCIKEQGKDIQSSLFYI